MTKPARTQLNATSVGIRRQHLQAIARRFQDIDGFYIGETSRPLSKRFQEHYRSATNPTAKSYKNMAFSKRKACHEGQKPKLKVKILKKTKSGSLERKVTEAVLIQKLKPGLNGQVNIVDFLIN